MASSRPACGADHQIAHLWEMDDLQHGGERVSHGACVAVGAMAALRPLRLASGAGPDRARHRRRRRRGPRLDRKGSAMIRDRFGPGEIAAPRARRDAREASSRAPRRASGLRCCVAVWPDLRRGCRGAADGRRPDGAASCARRARRPRPADIGVAHGLSAPHHPQGAFPAQPLHSARPAGRDRASGAGGRRDGPRRRPGKQGRGRMTSFQRSRGAGRGRDQSATQGVDPAKLDAPSSRNSPARAASSATAWAARG